MSDLFWLAGAQMARWAFGFCAALEFQHVVVNACDRAFKTLVDVPDLFHVERAIGQRVIFKDLDRDEQEKTGSVVNRQEYGRISAPTRARPSPFEERLSIRVEQRTTERREMQLRMVDAAKYAAEQVAHPLVSTFVKRLRKPARTCRCRLLPITG